MLIEKDIHKIFNSRFITEDHLKVDFDGSEVFIRFMDHSSKLSLITVVYNGGNYIPSSVRNCLSHKSPIFQQLPNYRPGIKTFLTVDEQHFQIRLNYLAAPGETLTYREFKELLEDFGIIAENWRLYLDENDKNDLVYVRVPK